MRNRMKVIAITFVILLASADALAQTAGVSLKPILKPGQEARYSLNGSVDTQVTTTGVNGINGVAHRELNVTLLLRAGVPAPPSASENTSQKAETTVVGAALPYSKESYAVDAGGPSKDVIYYEAAIEAFDVRLTVNGVDSPANIKSIVGQKIAFALDSAGHIVTCAVPVEAAKSGLADLLFSMLGWAPAAPLEVGQTWGNSADNDLPGYSYISAAALSDVPKSAKTAYTFAALNGSRAVVEGATTLRQEGASLVEIPAAQTKVNLMASGNGTTRIEYDVATNRMASAVSESSLKGRVVNIPPTRKGEKMQPREGALVETAKCSIKLLP
ncbi:MAG: hypothetical protein V7641_5388 [Blastocatellia bacterium]